MGLEVHCRPTLTSLVLVLLDVVVLASIVALCSMLSNLPTFRALHLVGVATVVLVSVGFLLQNRLYSPTPPSSPEELRRTSTALTLVFLGFAVTTLLQHRPAFGGFTAGTWTMAWLLCITFVPAARALARGRLAARPWWGHPVVVLGAGKAGRAVVRTLLNHPRLGIKPVALLDDDPSRYGTLRAAFGDDDLDVESVHGDERPDSQSLARAEGVDSAKVRATWEQFSEVEGVPIVGRLDLAPLLSQRLGIKGAVVAMPELDPADLLSAVERYSDCFAKVLVVPNLLGLAHFGASTRNLGGALGIEVRRQLLLPGPRLAKRVHDLVLTAVGGCLLLPLLCLVALAIKWDSRGPVLHRQRRLGQDGVRFTALTFRTLRAGGDVEPAMTRVGAFLRRWRIDALPQIYNVLVGDMSLVGPRPYREEEISEMDQLEVVILRVKPGITGMWQVARPGAVSFEERVRLDVEYVRNWSPWLDVHVLARSILVVLEGSHVTTDK